MIELKLEISWREWEYRQQLITIKEIPTKEQWDNIFNRIHKDFIKDGNELINN